MERGTPTPLRDTRRGVASWGKARALTGRLRLFSRLALGAAPGLPPRRAAPGEAGEAGEAVCRLPPARRTPSDPRWGYYISLFPPPQPLGSRPGGTQQGPFRHKRHK